MWSQIIAALRAAPGVSEWTVRVRRRRGAQLFLIGERVESRRRVVTDHAEVTVHVDHDGGRGTSSFVVLPGALGNLSRQIAQAVFMARLSKNPPFSLPWPTPYPEVTTADPAVRGNAPAVIDSLGEGLLAALRHEAQVRPSSLELFADDVTTDLFTSTGVEAQMGETNLMLELVVLSADGGGAESERQILHQWRRAADLDPASFAAAQAQFARDALDAQLPPAGEYPVVVRGEDLPEWFAPFEYHASAAAQFRKIARFAPGERVVENAGGDPLTITDDATLPFGLNSRAFDAEGLPGARVQLVRDGVLTNLWATNRYAQYLGVPATGETANLVVASGPTALADFFGEGPVIEVVSFSSLEPDEITGEFVGEIRLGYLHEGGRKRPLKGGSVSGNVFRDCGAARYAKERVALGGYDGPAAIRFARLAVAGA